MGWEPLPVDKDVLTFIECANFCKCDLGEIIQVAVAERFKAQITTEWDARISESEEAEADQSLLRMVYCDALLEVLSRDIRRSRLKGYLYIKRGRILEGPNTGKFAHFDEHTIGWGAVCVTRSDLEQYRATRPEPLDGVAAPVKSDSPKAEDLGETEKENLLCTIGAMARCIGDHPSAGDRYKLAGRLNIEAIVMAVEARLGKGKLSKKKGLGHRILHERITDGLRLLDDE